MGLPQSMPRDSQRRALRRAARRRARNRAAVFLDQRGRFVRTIVAPPSQRPHTSTKLVVMREEVLVLPALRLVLFSQLLQLIADLRIHRGARSAGASTKPEI